MTEERQIKEIVFTISKGSWDDVLMVQIVFDPNRITDLEAGEIHARISDFILDKAGRNIPVLSTVKGIALRLLGTEKDTGEAFAMTRLDWLACWDELREKVSKGNTLWGRNQIIEEMDKIERRKVRELEEEGNSANQEGK